MAAGATWNGWLCLVAVGFYSGVLGPPPSAAAAAGVDTLVVRERWHTNICNPEKQTQAERRERALALFPRWQLTQAPNNWLLRCQCIRVNNDCNKSPSDWGGWINMSAAQAGILLLWFFFIKSVCLVCGFDENTAILFSLLQLLAYFQPINSEVPDGA